MQAGANARSLLLAGIVGIAAAPASAQIREWGGVPDPGYAPSVEEIYIDEYGRQILLDAYGRVIAVEEGRGRGRGRGREAPGGGRMYDAPPPPGVALEGRVDPRDVYIEESFPAPTLEDPYARDAFALPPEERIEAAPLPEAPLPLPETDDGSRREALLPPREGAIAPQESEEGFDSDLGLPDPGASIIETPGSAGEFREGVTIQETDPAPAVASPGVGSSNAKAEIAALQVLLDRKGMSPGVIDGRMGSNVNKAVAAYGERYGTDLPTGNPAALMEELMVTGGPPVTTYTITNEDVAGPFVAAIPSDYSEKAQLEHMSFERVTEKLAERFHMDENYLREINPGADFDRPGTQLKVMNVGEPATGEVARIVADKGREQVRVYDAADQLISAYPATIGSASTPSPTGTVEVSRIAFDPNYTYNPKLNFKQGENDKVLTIPPGPNGPVGSIWIALSKPTYGIHGTPEPAQIGKTNSHGCVRLTNWDAAELAKMVKPGVTVEFVE